MQKHIFIYKKAYCITTKCQTSGTQLYPKQYGFPDLINLQTAAEWKPFQRGEVIFSVTQLRRDI